MLDTDSLGCTSSSLKNLLTFQQMEFNWYLRWCRIEGMRICGTTFTTMSPKWSTNKFPYVESYHPTNSILVMLWSTMRGLERLRKKEMGDYAYWFYSASSREWNKSYLHIGNSQEFLETLCIFNYGCWVYQLTWWRHQHTWSIFSSRLVFSMVSFL